MVVNGAMKSLCPAPSGLKCTINVGERYIRVWTPALCRVTCPQQCNNLRWGNALSHKLEVEERCYLASHYT